MSIRIKDCNSPLILKLNGEVKKNESIQKVGDYFLYSILETIYRCICEALI